MDQSRIIQLILPNKKLIKINISGDEFELRDLISEIAGINPLQIKGIKDSNGNYYTLSSAIKTEDIYKGQKNNFYELILGKENNKISLTKNNINSNIIFTNSPNVGNYIANYYINGIKKKNYSQNLSKSMNKMNFKQNDIEIFNKDLYQLMKNPKISKKEYYDLITLLHKKKMKLINENKSKHSSTKENYNMIKNNILFTENNNNIRSRTPILKPKKIEKIKIDNTSHIDNKDKLEIYEKMKDYFYEEDLDIIRLSLKYENEKVLNEINNFKKNNIISNLILIFKNFIAQYKKRKDIFGEKINYLFSSRKFDLENENENYSKDINDDKNLVNLNQSSEENIKKMLKKHNQILCDYFIKFEKEKYKTLEKIYEENNYYELNYLLNNECNKYMEEELKKYANFQGKILLTNEINMYYSLCNDNNSDIQKIFHEFQIEYKFLNLIKKIYDIITDGNNDFESEKLYYDKIKELFINDLSKLKINEKEIFKVKLLINQKNEKILNIINKYKETKKISYYEDDIKQLITNKPKNCFFKEIVQKKPSEVNLININNIINEETIKHIKNILSLSKDEIKILENNYKTDKNLNKIIIDYIQKTISISDFQNKFSEYTKSINNTNIRRNNIKQKTIKFNKIEEKKGKNDSKKELSLTPETIKKSKKELCCFLQNEEQIENKILIKQKEIINLLYKEECLDKKTFEIINKKITQDDQGLISAFEVYAISQDHIEFIETLKLIAELYDSHNESFYILLNHSSFNSSQKDKLISLFHEKNKKLIKALEKYESDLDKNTIYVTFNDLISMN